MFAATDPCRRTVLRSFGVLLGVVLAGGGRIAFGQGSGGALSVTIAGYPFDRFAGLFDGRVQVEGIDVVFESSSVGEMNQHLFNGPATRQISEVGIVPFILAFANTEFRDYGLLPIFPLKTFRHKSIFIRVDSGISGPEDLRGRRIGTPGYSSSALTWIRGMLEDEYGLTPKDIEWVIPNAGTSADGSGKSSDMENVQPEGVSIKVGPEGVDESDLLVSGEVDAIFHAVEPRAYIEGDPRVARLFPNPKAVEQDYFRRTGIFPVMHAVALKREVSDAFPWLAQAVFDAYSEAKALSYLQMGSFGWASEMLPWFSQELEETQTLMGKNFWTYGLGPNRKALETIIRYTYDQGLVARQLSVDELFLPSSLEFEDGSG